MKLKNVLRNSKEVVGKGIHNIQNIGEKKCLDNTLALEKFHMTGYLRKRNTKVSSPLFRNWDKRWFALNDDSLLYAVSPKELSAKQCFPVGDILEVKMIDEEGTDKEGKGVFEFEVTLPGRTLRLRPKSESQRRHWVAALEKARSGVRQAGSRESSVCGDELDIETHGLRRVKSSAAESATESSGLRVRAESERRLQTRVFKNEREPHSRKDRLLSHAAARSPDFEEEDWSTWKDEDLYIDDDDDDAIEHLTSPKRKHNLVPGPSTPPKGPPQGQRKKAQKNDGEDCPGVHKKPSKVYTNSMFDEEENDALESNKPLPPPVNKMCVAGVQQDTNWLDDDWDDESESDDDY